MTSNEMGIEKYFLVLRVRARLIMGFFAAAVLTAGTVTYLTPKMYTAVSSLNFELSGANIAHGGRRDELSRDSYFTTQLGIIESQHVAQEVENSLTKYERERLISALNAKSTAFGKFQREIKHSVVSFFTGNKGSAQEQSDGEALNIRSAYGWLARAIGSDLSVQPMFNSRIVVIAYSSTDRQIAALMANKFAEAYIAVNLQMMIDPASKTKIWFDAQLSSLRKKLQETQSRATEYQQQHGIVADDERLDAENLRLQSLSNQLVAAQQLTRNAVTSKQKLKEVLDSDESLMTFEAIFDNPVVQKVNANIRDLKGQLVEYSSRLGENHPKMKQLRSELSAAKSRLDAEILIITDGINNGAELALERERDLIKALETQKQLVLDLKYEHDKITVFLREVASAQTTYNAALKHMNEAGMQSMVDQANVSVVDPANIPSTPSSPIWTKNLVLGAVAGLLLGIGVALFMEMFVRRVYTRADLMLEMGVPMLGHLKKFEQ